MGGFSEHLEQLKAANISVVAASSDPQDKAAEQAGTMGFPIGYGVTQQDIESLGGYWEPRRQFAQPAEFLVSPEGRIVQLSYSDGPLARTEASDVLKLVRFLESRKSG